jgi:hypothetical protein
MTDPLPKTDERKALERHLKHSAKPLVNEVQRALSRREKEFRSAITGPGEEVLRALKRREKEFRRADRAHEKLTETMAAPEKIPEEIQLELLAPWYSENKRDSRTLDLFDAIPKYLYAVTTTVPKLVRLEIPFTLRGQKYLGFVAPARVTDAQTKESRLVFPAVERTSLNVLSALLLFSKSLGQS